MAINLLAWRQMRFEKRKRQWYLLLYSSLLISLACWSALSAKEVVLFLQQQSEISKLQRDIRTANSKYQNFLAADKLRQQQIQANIYIRNELLIDKTLLQLLQEITAKMPAEMYLTQIQKHNQAFRFSGKTTAHADITSLLQQLEHSREYGEPRLNETRHPDLLNPEIDFELTYEK